MSAVKWNPTFSTTANKNLTACDQDQDCEEDEHCFSRSFCIKYEPDHPHLIPTNSINDHSNFSNFSDFIPDNPNIRIDKMQLWLWILTVILGIIVIYLTRNLLQKIGSHIRGFVDTCIQRATNAPKPHPTSTLNEEIELGKNIQHTSNGLPTQSEANGVFPRVEIVLAP